MEMKLKSNELISGDKMILTHSYHKNHKLIFTYTMGEDGKYYFINELGVSLSIDGDQIYTIERDK